MLITLLILIIFQLFNLNNSFNIDVKYPIIFEPGNLKAPIYFGSSVAIQSSGNVFKYIIGAPKAFDEKLKFQTGQAYGCKIINKMNTSCEILNYSQGKTKYMHYGSEVNSLGKQTLICGPTWTNTKYTGSNNPSGTCTIQIDNGVGNQKISELSPFIARNFQGKNGPNNADYYYSHAEMGFSSNITEDEGMLVIGAPGFSDWQGGVVLYYTLNLARPSIFFKPDSTAYMGYAVTTGKFFTDNLVYIVAGAPRAGNTGVVYFFRADGKNSGRSFVEINNKFHLLRNPPKRTGQQFGEYFGSSLLTVDINRDGWDDLIVGAPFFTPTLKQRGDVGRIFVYMSNGHRLSDTPQIITNEKALGARFGYAMADLGDLNYDDYRDIAVGAPYEDGRGAVYIYLGKKDGLSRLPSQKISASEHFPQYDLKGFGVSLYGTSDIDDNYYPDLLVGSYLSDKAVLLRSKPVASLKGLLTFVDTNSGNDIEQIQLKDVNCKISGLQNSYACFNVSYCLTIVGKHLRSNQGLAVKIDIDSLHKRRGFALIEQKSVTEFSKKYFINAETPQCFEQFTIYLSPTIEDKVTDFEINLGATLENEETEDDFGLFCSKCPLLQSKLSLTKSIPFEIGCGSDRRCLADIIVQMSTDSESIIQGRDELLMLTISVLNKGENAFSTKLSLNIRPFLEINQVEAGWNIEEMNYEVKFSCDIDNPLEKQKTKVLKIPFQLSKLISTANQIDFDAMVTTSSEFSATSIMKSNLTIQVARFASLALSSNEEQEDIIYGTKMNGNEKLKKVELLNFTNSITLTKKNYSSVENVNVRFKIPAIVKDDPVTFLPSIKLLATSNSGTSIKCNFRNSKLNFLPDTEFMLNEFKSVTPVDEFNEPKVEIDENIEKRDLTKMNDLQLNMNSQMKKPIRRSDEKSLSLDCSTTECEIIDCQLGPFGNNDQTVHILYRSSLNITAVERHFTKSYDSVKFDVNIEAHISDENIRTEPISLNAPVWFRKIPEKEAISSMLIIVSSSVGVILLIIIFALLFKFGFFRRKKREEMLLLKRKTMTCNVPAIGNLSEQNENEANNEISDTQA